MLILKHPSPDVIPPGVFIDTDMAGDADDTVALALLCRWHLQRYIKIIGVAVCAANDESAPVARAILDYYGLTSIPVGANQSGSPSMGSFMGPVRDRFRPGDTKTNYPDATDVYRSVISAQSTQVTLLTIGFSNEVRKFYDSAADEISDSTGAELVNDKILRWVAMGTQVTSGNEYNIDNSAEDWAYLLPLWPTDVTFLDKIFGESVPHRLSLDSDPLTNPVKHAFDLYTANTNASYDLLAALYVISPELFDVSENSTVTVNGTTGDNTWTSADDDKYYLIKSETTNTYIYELERPLKEGSEAVTTDDALFIYAPLIYGNHKEQINDITGTLIGTASFETDHLLTPNNTSGAYFTMPSQFYTDLAVTEYTVVVVVDITSADGFGKLLCIPYRSDGWNSPWIALSLSRDGGSDTQNEFAYAVNSGSVQAISSFTWPGTGLALVGATRNGASVKNYSGNKLITTETYGTNVAPDFTNQRPVTLLTRSHTSVGESTVGKLYFAGIWARELTAVEIDRIYKRFVLR